MAGEIFAELVRLGKETLQDGTDSAKNVSAVLIAAAFEDLMRRMGSDLAGVVGRPKLEDVLIALKNAGKEDGCFRFGRYCRAMLVSSTDHPFGWLREPETIPLKSTAGQHEFRTKT